MNLIVDIGNSSVKAAVFDGETMVQRKRLTHDVADNLAMLAEDYTIDACAFASVGTPMPDVADVLRHLVPDTLYVTGLTPTPLVCDYHSPETLGADRLAVAVAAAAIAPGCNIMVVDAGTCITYEYISAEGHYLGGNISPGLGMRLHSLHEQTALLPLVHSLGQQPDCGYDTATAIRSGVLMGLEYEIEGYIRSFHRAHPDGRVFVTGGNGYRFAGELEVDRNDALVETGLNRILLYNS